MYVYNKDKELAPWPWFIHETLFRLTEFGLACTVIYAVSPLRPPKKCLLGCSWCCFESGTDEITASRGEYRERTGTNQMTSLGPPTETAGNNNV